MQLLKQTKKSVFSFVRGQSGYIFGLSRWMTSICRVNDAMSQTIFQNNFGSVSRNCKYIYNTYFDSLNNQNGGLSSMKTIGLKNVGYNPYISLLLPPCNCIVLTQYMRKTKFYHNIWCQDENDSATLQVIDIEMDEARTNKKRKYKMIDIDIDIDSGYENSTSDLDDRPLKKRRKIIKAKRKSLKRKLKQNEMENNSENQARKRRKREKSNSKKLESAMPAATLKDTQTLMQLTRHTKSKPIDNAKVPNIMSCHESRLTINATNTALSTDELIINIASMLNFQDITLLNRVNKQFYQVLNVSFWLNKEKKTRKVSIGISYFSCEIKQCIERDLIDDLTHLPLFYFQLFNFKNQEMIFKSIECSKPSESSDKNENEIKIETRPTLLVQKQKFQRINKTIKQKKSNSNQILPSALTKRKNKWYNCGMFNRIFSRIKKMNKLIDKNIFKNNNLIDYFILARLYNVKFVNNMFFNLIKTNEAFLTAMICELNSHANEDNNGKTLDYIWQGMGSSHWFKLEKFMKCFAVFSIKSNFDGYQTFVNKVLKSNCNIDRSKEDQDCLVNGIRDTLECIGLFLNHNLYDQFIYPKWFDGFQTVARLLEIILQPKILLRLKRKLSDAMIPLTKIEEKSFDLFGNIEQYHPTKRLLFLQKLAFSPHITSLISFGEWKNECDSYLSLRSLILKLYKNFDHFSKEFLLSHYSEYKDDCDKQKQLWNEFRCIIQYLMSMGLWHVSLKDDSAVYSLTPIIQACKSENDENYVATCKNGEMHDLRPSNMKQLKAMWKWMQQDITNVERAMKRMLRYPACDRNFNLDVDPAVNNNKRLRFDNVDDPYDLLCQVWDIGQKYGTKTDKICAPQ